jgi:hypothetical protein
MYTKNQETPETTKSSDSNHSQNRRPLRKRRAAPMVFAALALSFVATSCSKDKSDDTVAEVVTSEAGSAVSDAGAAVSDAGSAVSEAMSTDSTMVSSDSTVMSTSSTADASGTAAGAAAAAEGPAKGYAMKMVTELQSMADGGQPTVANFTTAAATLGADAKMTGVEDTDNNGKDDDSKVTITVDDDKACLQNQNAVWEVTDDEC